MSIATEGNDKPHNMRDMQMGKVVQYEIDNLLGNGKFQLGAIPTPYDKSWPMVCQYY